MPDPSQTPTDAASVNEQRLLDTFLTLVRFNTPSRREKSVSEWAGAYLRALGFTVEWDVAAHLLLRPLRHGRADPGP